MGDGVGCNSVFEDSDFESPKVSFSERPKHQRKFLEEVFPDVAAKEKEEEKKEKENN